MIYGTEQPHELRVNSYKPELKVKVVSLASGFWSNLNIGGPFDWNCLEKFMGSKPKPLGKIDTGHQLAMWCWQWYGPWTQLPSTKIWAYSEEKREMAMSLVSDFVKI